MFSAPLLRVKKVSLRAKKRYGQHFLQPAWADRLVTAIAPAPVDRFLEIGPGPGALTCRLAARVEHVTAIELDTDMIEILSPQLPANVTLIHQDFLEFDLARLVADGPVRVAGNLPYNVSSAILFRLIDAHRRAGGITDATLMLQREVAQRLVARPGSRDFGILSVFVQLHADVRSVLSLPPGAFRPAPKVHSAVVALTFRAPAVCIRDGPSFEAMVRSMFTQRRKTLLNALRAFSEARGKSPGEALVWAAIDPKRRPETLQLAEMARLADFFTGG